MPKADFDDTLWYFLYSPRGIRFGSNFIAEDVIGCDEQISDIYVSCENPTHSPPPPFMIIDNII